MTKTVLTKKSILEGNLIFVTLGTQDKQFGRLIEAVNRIETDEEIIAQIGSTKCSKINLRSNIKIFDYLSDDEFDRYMKEARIVITHAGVGTIIKGLKLHKKMIVAARLKKYKEHVNDHQIQILNTFAEDGYIIPLENFDDLTKLINMDFKPKEFKSNNEKFNDELEKII